MHDENYEDANQEDGLTPENANMQNELQKIREEITLREFNNLEQQAPESSDLTNQTTTCNSDISVSELEESQQEEEKTLETPPSDIFFEIKEALSKLQEKSDNLQKLFEQSLLYDQHKDLVNDRQYEELSAFRNGLLEKLKKTIIDDIIFEIDDAVKSQSYFENAEFSEDNFRKLLKMCKNFASNLCDLLEKHEIFSFQSESGTAFDPKTQTAQKKRITNNPELRGLVAQSLRYGFKQVIEKPNEDPQYKILRREIVEVYIYQPSENAQTSENSQPAEAAASSAETAEAADASSAQEAEPKNDQE